VKVSEANDTLTTAPVPVPERLTVCVLPGIPLLSSVMIRLPLRVPIVEGLKVTAIRHWALAAKLPPQELVWEKSPFAVMLAIVKAALPVLLNVTV
jgi:hypothetical protein